MSKLIFFQLLLIIGVQSILNSNPTSTNSHQERSRIRYVARPHHRAPHPPQNRPHTAPHPPPPARRLFNRPAQQPNLHRKPAHLPTRKDFRFHQKSPVPFTILKREPVVKQMFAKNPAAVKRKVINGVVTLVTDPIPTADFSVDINPSSSQELSSISNQAAQAIAPPAFQAPIQELQTLSTFQPLPYRAASPLSLLEKEELLNNRIFSLFRELNVTSFILKTEEFSVRALVSPVRTQFIPIEDDNVAAMHGFGIDRLRREQIEELYEHRLRSQSRKNKKKNKKNKKKTSRQGSELSFESLYGDKDNYGRYGQNHPNQRSLFAYNDERSRFYNYNSQNTFNPQTQSTNEEFKKKV